MNRPLLSLFALLALTALSPRTASAAFLEEKDESHKWGTLSFGPRFFLFDQEEYREVYSDTGLGTAFQLQAGWVPIARYVSVELEFGLGILRKGGTAVNLETGEEGADRVLLTLFPLSMGLVVGLDPVREFPVVPFGRVGLEVIPWKEHDAEVVIPKEDSPIGEILKEGDGSSIDLSGVEWTAHVGFGLQLLLDRLEPARAGILDARAGINDTWLVVEARRSFSLGASSEGIDLASWSILGTVKFAY